MHIKWLHPEPRPQPPEPIHSLPGHSFAEMKRQIEKKPPEMRKQVFILKSHRPDPYK